MACVWIPPLLRDLTGGQETVAVPGTRVSQLIDELERRYPGIEAPLCDGDSLRPGLVVVVDTTVAVLGLLRPVGPDSEVHFLPAVGGG
jgi:molybdopterin synthase sulfur carrier subunit